MEQKLKEIMSGNEKVYICFKVSDFDFLYDFTKLSLDYYSKETRELEHCSKFDMQNAYSDIMICEFNKKK